MERHLHLTLYAATGATIIWGWQFAASTMADSFVWRNTDPEALLWWSFLFVLPFLAVWFFHLWVTLTGWRLVAKQEARNKNIDERFSGLTFVFDPDNLELSKRLAETYTNPNAKREGKVSWLKLRKLHGRRMPNTARHPTATARITSGGTRP